MGTASRRMPVGSSPERRTTSDSPGHFQNRPFHPNRHPLPLSVRALSTRTEECRITEDLFHQRLTLGLGLLYGTGRVTGGGGFTPLRWNDPADHERT